jgi:NRAMP (natural resistance-associated macrophage protein)-like metal ion transporter
MRRRLLNGLRRVGFYLSIFGPGLITASAGNDAPGIATYSMTGSTYGYNMLWLIVLVTVGGITIQEMAARMGAVTGKGAADLIREQYGVRVTAFAMVCLLLANLGTTLAEFAGVAAGMELLGVTRYVAIPLAALGVGYMVLRGSYKRVEKVLLVLSLVALSYVITVFVVNPSWEAVLRNAVVPTLKRDPNYILTALAVIGTTITPWAFVYMEASVADKGVTTENYRYTRMDVIGGAAWGNMVSAFIVIATAATLFVHGIQVESAEQAALALEPLVGQWARYFFSAGLLGASLLAASVLPLSTSYAICEAFGWERGLDRRTDEAPVFYGLYGGIIILSVLVVLVPGIPLFPMMWLSQSLNAVLLPVLLILVLRIANDGRVMKGWSNSRIQNALAWGLTGVIGLATLALLFSPFLT